MIPVCPWCETTCAKVPETLSIYTCWCHGTERAACQIHVVLDKIVTFYVYSEQEPLCCFFINRGYALPHWGIESLIAGSNDIIYVTDGVITLSQAIDKLHQFKNLKAFF